MTVGGLLQRFLVDSTRDLVSSELRRLGWFDANRRHRPLQVIAEPVRWDIPVEPNLIAAYVQSTIVEEVEVGNERLVLSSDSVVVTVLAETEGIGIHLAGDVRDILAANMGDGRRAIVPIFDYRQATPPQIAYAVIDDVSVAAPPSHSRRSWLAHWYDVQLETRTAYSAAILAGGTYPGPGTFPGPDTFPGGL